MCMIQGLKRNKGTLPSDVPQKLGIRGKVQRRLEAQCSEDRGTKNLWWESNFSFWCSQGSNKPNGFQTRRDPPLVARDVAPEKGPSNGQKRLVIMASLPGRHRKTLVAPPELFGEHCLRAQPKCQWLFWRWRLYIPALADHLSVVGAKDWC